jgi:hypothetical protein
MSRSPLHHSARVNQNDSSGDLDAHQISEVTTPDGKSVEARALSGGSNMLLRPNSATGPDEMIGRDVLLVVLLNRFRFRLAIQMCRR